MHAEEHGGGGGEVRNNAAFLKYITSLKCCISRGRLQASTLFTGTCIFMAVQVYTCIMCTEFKDRKLPSVKMCQRCVDKITITLQ